MSRTVYLNGAWLPEEDAKISIFDRGFLFADAIYEVTAVIDGKLIDYAGHAARLNRSLSELGIECPATPEAMLEIHREIVKRNALQEGLIYLQISRGPADRDFLFPVAPTPTLTLFTQTKNIQANPTAQTGISVVTLPDLRWSRRDIKTVQLLYPSMAKMEAKSRGADDAWLIDDGLITEASSANAHIVTKDGVLVTRDLSTALLHGITRASVLDLARANGIPAQERAFTPQEAKQAAEAFITSATSFVQPVVRIDDVTIGDGSPGPISQRLRQLYLADRLKNAI